MRRKRLLVLAILVGSWACAPPTYQRDENPPPTKTRNSTGGQVGPGGNATGGNATGGAASDGSGAGGRGAPNDTLAPTNGALLGLNYGANTIATTDARIGRSPPIHFSSVGWEDAWEDVARTDLQAGRIPLVNWEPVNVDFNDIVNGAWDITIEARANGAKALHKRLFIEFGAEMNGDEAWSDRDASLFVAAYRYIHDSFVTAGASNVLWVWSPNVTDTDRTNDMTFAYYPGDAYVDWPGVHGYNWGGDAWQSFEDVFANIYPLLAARNKPIMIGEMASAEQGGNKAAWIDAIIPTLKARFPLVKAMVWVDSPTQSDWRINSSAATQAAFSRLANDAYFNQ